MPISFDNTAQAFQYKNIKELTLSKWMFIMLRSNFFNKIGGWLLINLLRIKLPISWIVKATIYKQFVGGENLEQADKTAQKIFQYQVFSMLDYGKEANEKEESFEETTEKFITSIKFAHNKEYFPFICIKISGLASTKLLLAMNDSPRLRSGIHEHENLISAWEIVKDRVFRIVSAAAEHNMGVLIDAEETWIQDPIDRLAIELMTVFNTKKAVVYNTYQLYLKDRLDFFLMNHKSISQKKGFILGAKLVRGAYMEKERAQASSKNYPCPVQINKEQTDLAFNNAVLYALQNVNSIHTIIATHNEESCLKATEVMSQYKILEKDPRIFFSQLYGMSDNISFVLAKAGYNVAKYLPYGSVSEVIPYLMRRANENSSISKQSQRELDLIKSELHKRKH
ncbi:MAG: proline dehydrogenase family protein [Sediminibacterium sp.]|nr:proline dehydrogenase family protein [Sediminibacterium sp.]